MVSLPSYKNYFSLFLFLMMFGAFAQAETGVETFPDDPETMQSDLDAFDTEISEQLEVDESIYAKKWNEVPFSSAQKVQFTYTLDELPEKWPTLMRGLLIPYPSAAYLKKRFEAFPELKAEIVDFDGDYKMLSDKILGVWIMFFRGDFQRARNEGLKYGAIGAIPANFAQVIYAIYLVDTQDEKHMLLQGVVKNSVHYGKVLKKMKKIPEFSQDYMTIRLGYAYALGRIAEEVPTRTAIVRNYAHHLAKASKDILKAEPNHPVGLAFRAGVDANIMRRVGKATGRLTYGAKQTVAVGHFEKSLDKVGSMSIINYEYGNSLLYMNNKRDLDTALAQFKLASEVTPNFSMEALDALYAKKRLTEIESFKQYRRSFRSFERKRRKYQKSTRENMCSVRLAPFDIMDFTKKKKKKKV